MEGIKPGQCEAKGEDMSRQRNTQMIIVSMNRAVVWTGNSYEKEILSLTQASDILHHEDLHLSSSALPQTTIHEGNIRSRTNPQTEPQPQPDHHRSMHLPCMDLQPTRPETCGSGAPPMIS